MGTGGSSSFRARDLAGQALVDQRDHATTAQQCGQQRKAFGGQRHLALNAFGAVEPFRMALNDGCAQSPLQVRQSTEQREGHVIANRRIVGADGTEPAIRVQQFPARLGRGLKGTDAEIDFATAR